MRHTAPSQPGCCESLRPLAVLMLLLAFALPARADETGLESARVAVLIDPAAPRIVRDLAAILEVQLAQQNRIELVERANIDKVLREQTLATLFGADAAQGRLALGKILRADVLVLLRPVPANGNDKPPAPQGNLPEAGEGKLPGAGVGVELIVSETRRGLRVLSQRIEEVDPAATDAITAMTLQAVARTRQPITNIIAIPTFISRSLDYRDDQLRYAYTTLLEQLALSNPNLLVVELEEAQAIARELQLTAGDRVVSRDLPLYVLGEFEVKRAAAGDTIEFTLRLNRGNRETATQQLNTLDLSDAPTKLREAAAAMLVKADARELPAMDASAEITQLVQRADQHVAVGDLITAIHLLQAARLLETDRTDLGTRIADLIGRLLPSMYTNAPVNEDQALRARQAVNLWKSEASAYAGALHQYFLTRKPAEWREADRKYLVYLDTLLFNNASPLLAEGSRTKLRSEVYELRRSARDVLVTGLEGMKLDDPAVAPLLDHAQLFLSTTNVTFDENEDATFDKLYTAQIAVRAYPGDLPLFLSPFGTTDKTLNHLRRIEAYGDARLTTLAFSARMLLEDRLLSTEFTEAYRLRPQQSVKPEETKATQPPAMPELATENIEFPEAVQSWIAAGEGVDVVASRGAVYVVKGKGKPQRIYVYPTALDFKRRRHRSEGLESLHSDGRYIWAPFAASDPVIAVWDTRSKKLTQVTSEQGLPPANMGLTVATLGEGQLLVCGAGGTSYIDLRTWIGTLDIHQGSPRFKMLLEAKSAATTETRTLTPDHAFVPLRIRVFERDDQQLALMDVAYNTGSVRAAELQQIVLDLSDGSIVKRYTGDKRFIAASGIDTGEHWLAIANNSRYPGPWWSTYDVSTRSIEPIAYASRSMTAVLPYGDGILGATGGTNDPLDLWYSAGIGQPWAPLGRVNTPVSELGGFQSWHIAGSGFTWTLTDAPILVRSQAYGGLVLLLRGQNHTRIQHIDLSAKVLSAAKPTATLDPEAIEFRGHHYLPVLSPLPRDEAEHVARQLGGRLAAARDEATRAFLARLPEQPHKSGLMRLREGEAQRRFWWIDDPDATVTDNTTAAALKGSLVTQRKATDANGYLIEWGAAGPSVVTPTRWYTLDDGRPAFTNSLGMTFVWIPPGTLTMGSPQDEPNRQPNESQHQVTLTRGFFMATGLVTRAQYHALLGDLSPIDNVLRSLGPSDDLPANYMSGYSGLKIAERLGEVEGRKYRLPTEAEWEYACRAGTTTAYSFGDDPQLLKRTALVNQADNWHLAVRPRKPEPPMVNPWGLANMHGGLWEWCLMASEQYPDEAVTDPGLPVKYPLSTQSRYILRGGSFKDPTPLARSAQRLTVDISTSMYASGVRLVADALPLGRDPVTGEALAFEVEGNVTHAQGSLIVSGEGFEIATMRAGEPAFSNRNYRWPELPAKFNGATYTRTAGGNRARILVSAREKTTVYAVTAPSQTGVDLTGWQPVEGMNFDITDRRHTTMQVYQRDLNANESIEVPQGNWTGTAVIIPSTPSTVEKR